jgi:osmoprotectant transport system substrate-binding protein
MYFAKPLSRHSAFATVTLVHVFGISMTLAQHRTSRQQTVRAPAGWFVVCLALLLIHVPARCNAQSVVVGGKNYTEQLLMAEVTTQLLRSRGYDVERRSGYDTTSLRKAQEAGLVDIYWEYTGTSLRELNKSTDLLNPAEAYERVKRLDASKGLIWLKPSQVNNSYALAMRRTEAAKRGIATISDLARRVNSGERFVFASNYEFYERADGLRPLERAYGFEFGRDQVIRLDTNMIYQVLHDLRNIDVGLVFATDGRVAAYDLQLLTDDRGFFPDYTMAPVIRQQTLQRHPELASHLDSLSALLDNEVMAQLNAMIDVDQKRIRAVASEFLIRSGLR